ncbi:hypothetical protein EVAR_24880_1 [Eumeta japonica]|uniref:Uncharacterized protein n=1 Tax=Eumeta variegata TaxID=151549 RepID=A0A4C1V6E4_EUMVA|nr:hypothetical protein EVAR_24880_1 [Eumeta japonica]
MPSKTGNVHAAGVFPFIWLPDVSILCRPFHAFLLPAEGIRAAVLVIDKCRAALTKSIEDSAVTQADLVAGETPPRRARLSRAVSTTHRSCAGATRTQSPDATRASQNIDALKAYNLNARESRRINSRVSPNPLPEQGSRAARRGRAVNDKYLFSELLLAAQTQARAAVGYLERANFAVHLPTSPKRYRRAVLSFICT